MRFTLLPICLALLSVGVSAETYRWVDSSGQAHIGDTLPSGNVKNLRATSRDNDRQSSNSKGTTPTPTPAPTPTPTSTSSSSKGTTSTSTSTSSTSTSTSTSSSSKGTTPTTTPDPLPDPTPLPNGDQPVDTPPAPVPDPVPTPTPLPTGTAQLRGVVITMMDPPYSAYSQSTGPTAGTHYPVLNTKLIDYYAAKNVSAIRFQLAWEAMQPTLNGSVPGAAANYQTYWTNYKRIVDYATGKGIQIIIGPWQAGTDGGVCGPCYRGQLVGSQVPISAFADFWGKIATLFKGNPKVSYVLVSEPHNMSTKTWFQAAQAAVTAIRNAGSTQRIYVPGISYTAANSWTSANWDDTDKPAISNATGWLTANNGGPLYDPQNNVAVEVHTYLDSDQSGSTTCISSANAAANQMKVTVDWARSHNLKVYLGEIGLWAGFNSASPPSGCKPSGTFTAATAWNNFITYFNANADTFEAYTWWAASDPAWWKDVAANGGGHFSVSPTNGTTYTGDTINMQMIQGGFQ